MLTPAIPSSILVHNDVRVAEKERTMPEPTRDRFLGKLVLAGCLFLLFGCVALAEDWPMWRFDPHRSTASSEELGRELHLQWVRDLPPSMLAWPNETRLQFDACYEPIVAGKTLLVGSPNDGSVAAFDTETGVQQWKHFTEGPVRFAPWRRKARSTSARMTGSCTVSTPRTAGNCGRSTATAGPTRSAAPGQRPADLILAGSRRSRPGRWDRVFCCRNLAHHGRLRAGRRCRIRPSGVAE